MAPRTDILHHYRRYRRHQMATYGNSGEYVAGVDQRKFTGGGAAYGMHALAAFNAARLHLHTVRTMRANLRGKVRQ